MFIILGLLILAVSFVIALVSLIGEQRQIANVREKMAPRRQPPVVPESGQKEVLVDQQDKIQDEEKKEEIYPWEQKREPKAVEAPEAGRKFDKVTISIRDLANSAKRELPDT